MINMNETEQPPARVEATRREPRYSVNKDVQVTVEGATVPATLVDQSLHGFRIRIAPGCVRPRQVITLHYAWGDVQATVVWTRNEEKYSEAGLLVP
ncbi:MAG: PilZ domain-containing protein [Acidobacteria bacterium]|nr:PilZ domain-containing protein [Acidobacteriota bacterium]